MDDVVFVAFLGPDDQESRAVFRKAAAKYGQEFSFGIRTIVDVGSPDLPKLKCFMKFGGDARSFDRPFEDGPLESFIEDASVYTLAHPRIKTQPTHGNTAALYCRSTTHKPPEIP